MAQVQGEEIYLSHSGQEVDDNIDEVVAARGSEASLSARLADIVRDFDADQQRQEAEIGAVAALGAKNFLKNDAVSQTISGVTFTVNGDGTVALSGTAVSNITSFFIRREAPALTGNMILSGCPEGGSTSTYRLDILDGTPTGSVLFEDHGEGTDVDWNQITTGMFTARIRIGSGTTVDGLTFKPMLRRAEITDDTYEPYAPTNRELYEAKTEQTETNVIANLGAKNLLAYNGYGTGAENGVAYSINTDGTITVSGTPQGTSPSYIELKLNGNAANIARFCDGQHILSGCPAGGGDNKYRMYAARGGYSRFDYGDGVLLTGTTQTDVRLVVFIANGYIANNLVFKPMIRRAEITDDTYVPYAPTNRELYEMILALQSGASAQSAASLMQAGRLDAAELTDAQEATENDT